jgi:hypothetical protein
VGTQVLPALAVQQVRGSGGRDGAGGALYISCRVHRAQADSTHNVHVRQLREQGDRAGGGVCVRGGRERRREVA